jgi:hypothetical protein
MIFKGSMMTGKEDLKFNMGYKPGAPHTMDLSVSEVRIGNKHAGKSPLNLTNLEPESSNT